MTWYPDASHGERVAPALIGLGSNLPFQDLAGAALLAAAQEALAAEGVVPVRTSRVWRTAPVGASGAVDPEQPSFANAVALVRVSAALTPLEVLDRLQAVERAFGRRRDTPFAPRTLDLDLLDLDGLVLTDEAGLVLPHPRLHRRAFVLGPLCDVAPEWRHPTLDRTARQLLEDLAPEGLSPLQVAPEAPAA